MKPLLLLLFSLCWLTGISQNNYIFSGGNEDGAAQSVTERPAHNSIFNGGNEDGSAIQHHSQADNNRIFFGGNEDGFAREYASTPDNNAIFGGGVEDGFAIRYHSLPDNSRIFGGGIDDGGNSVNISVIDNNSIFAGGIDDGGAHFYATGLPSSFPTPFAVELLTFEAIPLQDKVQLLWTTLSEINHDYFLLERSADLVQIEFIAQVSGKGSPDLPQSYEHWDYHPLSGRSYYRLVPVDIDGEIQPSNWVEVNFDQIEKTLIQAFPNPTSGALRVSFQYAVEMEQIKPQLFDLHGRQLSISFHPENSTTLRIDLSNLPQAFYLLKVIDPRTQLPVSFRIQKK